MDTPTILAHLPLDRHDERPAAVTATNRGDIAATLVHRLRGGPAAELDPALAGYVRAATAGLPRLAARVALVLDCSASMRGYGEREWAVLSQAVALRLVLAEVCERLDVIEVGGREDAPVGATDLALGLLDAAELEPGLVVIVTDGYENTWPGDLARVAASLAGPPVLLCHAAYSHSDDLALRDPAPGLPSRAFWHEQDFEHLLPWLFAHSPAGKAWIRDLVLSAPDVQEGGRT
ncbi:hypothetical protein [Nonomuraea sediminis]|uniref:hypothetical protein n=1 Tax=Nonomuraea sediminis TaxID=2835864 RepID=UPI001BDCA716|nr:hypothetical protein [Nonomuraea sediminis]